MIASCNKRLVPYTVVKIETVYDTLIEYRDTTVYDTIRGDTVHDSIQVPYIPPELRDLITSDPVWAENKYSKGKAWIRNAKLYISLILKEQVLDTASYAQEHKQDPGYHYIRFKFKA